MHKINTDTIQEKLVKPSFKKHQPSWLSALSFNFSINDDVHCTKSMIRNPFFAFKKCMYKFMRWLKSKGTNKIFGGIDGSDKGKMNDMNFDTRASSVMNVPMIGVAGVCLFVLSFDLRRSDKNTFFPPQSLAQYWTDAMRCDCDWVRNCIHKLISLDKKNMSKMLRCGWHTTQYAILFDLSFILRWKKKNWRK